MLLVEVFVENIFMPKIPECSNKSGWDNLLGFLVGDKSK